MARKPLARHGASDLGRRCDERPHAVRGSRGQPRAARDPVLVVGSHVSGIVRIHRGTTNAENSRDSAGRHNRTARRGPSGWSHVRMDRRRQAAAAHARGSTLARGDSFHCDRETAHHRMKPSSSTADMQTPCEDLALIRLRSRRESGRYAGSAAAVSVAALERPVWRRGLVSLPTVCMPHSTLRAVNAASTPSRAALPHAPPHGRRRP